jgi:hypothetical protein
VGCSAARMQMELHHGLPREAFREFDIGFSPRERPIVCQIREIVGLPGPRTWRKLPQFRSDACPRPWYRSCEDEKSASTR